jgi:NitT/TauT family transport system substrate-binding protein
MMMFPRMPDDPVRDREYQRAALNIYLMSMGAAVQNMQLAEAGKITQVRDLKGLRLAAFAKGTITDYVLDQDLAHGGVSQRDVDVQYLAPPNIVKALAGKALDGGVLAEPWVARAETEGVAVRFALTDPVPSLQDQQTAYILFGGKFIREKGALARRFVQAYLEGVSYYTDRGGTKDGEILDILSRIIGADKDSIRRSIPAMLARDGRPDLENLARIQDWFVKRGMQEKAMELNQVVDLSFLPR